MINAMQLQLTLHWQYGGATNIFSTFGYSTLVPADK